MNFSDFNQAFQPFSDNDFSDFLFQDNAMDLLKGPTPDFSIANNAFPSPPRSIHNFSPANVMELLNLNSFPEFSMPMPVASQSFNNVPMFSTFQSPLQTLDFSPSLDSIFNNSFPQQIMGSNGNMQFKQLSFSSASSSSPELGFAPLIRSQTLSPPFISASPAFSASGFSTESAPRRNLGVRTRAIAHVKPAKEGFNRNLKIMKEDVAVCSGCSVEIATIILHGTEEAIAQPYFVDMLCMACEFKHQDPNPTRNPAVEMNIKNTSVQGFGPSTKSECDCCKRVVAKGCVRSGDSSTAQWTEPQFGVEIVCSLCRDKYGLCTECGGGNKYRTGKWRPLELFQEGRRTCNFSHTRIGKTPVRYQTMHVNTEISMMNYRCIHGFGCNGCSFESVLTELKDMFIERKLYAYAVPSIMESVPSCMNWEKLNEKINSCWETVQNFLLSPCPEGKRRYIDLAFITPPVPRRKAKSEPIQAMAGDQMIAGFVMGEWDINNSTFQIGQRVNRGVGGDPCSMVLEMSKNLILRAVADAPMLATMISSPVPTHIYVTGFTRFFTRTIYQTQITGNYNELVADMEFTEADFAFGRVGFTTAANYAKRYDIEENVLNRITPATIDDSLYLVNLKDLLHSSSGATGIKKRKTI